MGASRIDVNPLCGALGAEVSGVDLSQPLSPDVIAEVREAFLEHGVVCFRDQELPRDRHVALAREFGEPDVHPIVEGMEEFPEVLHVSKPAGDSASFGVGWHTDNSFFEKPSLGTLLYGVVIPPYGGDTLFANTERAYAALSSPMQRLLAGLEAVHSASRAYDPAITGTEKYDGTGKGTLRYRWSELVDAEVRHPVVRTHPETGRKSIYVNPMFTQRIPELTDAESRALLDFLYAHCACPDFTCRLRWEPKTVALWDNRSVWHYAMDDYREFERVMYRVTIQGDRPV